VSYARQYDYWDEVIGTSRWSFYNNPLIRFRFLLNIRKCAFDSVLVTSYSRSFYVEDSIVKASNAAERTGFHANLSNISEDERKQGDAYYTRLIDTPGEYASEFLRNAILLTNSGAPPWQPEPAKLVHNDSGSSIEPFDYVLLPGSGMPYRRWHKSRFSELTDRIYKETGFKGVILGASSDRSLAHWIKQHSLAPLVDLTGQTSIDELISIIKDARFVIGNESGGAHIAAAVATPSITILGGGHFQRFMPYPESVLGAVKARTVVHHMECFQCNWNCRYTKDESKPFPCIDGISVDVAWRQVQAIIEML
ncbi:MAG: glycosyltransferase family 9 protein, partial [Gammaproteobacteria bacterium]